MSQLIYNPSSGASTLLQLTVEYLPLPHHKQWYQLREYHWCDCQVTWGSGLPAHAVYLYSYYLWHSLIYSSNDKFRLGPSIITAWPVQKKLAHHGLLNWLPMVKISTSSRTQCHFRSYFSKSLSFSTTDGMSLLKMAWHFLPKGLSWVSSPRDCHKLQTIPFPNTDTSNTIESDGSNSPRTYTLLQAKPIAKPFPAQVPTQNRKPSM